MEQENINTFYKQVADIESLHRKDVFGSLNSYFDPIRQGKNRITWIKNIDQIIKDQVEQSAIKYLK